MATLTVYPSVGTMVNGHAARWGVDESFSSIRTNAGNQHDDTADTIYCYARCSATSNQWQNMARAIFLFDASALPAGATISAAKVGFTVNTAFSGIAGQSVNIVGSTPASDTALADADYAQLGSTKYSDDVAVSSLSGNTYISLNATGIAALTDGVNKLGMRLTCDIDNSAPTWSSNAEIGLVFYGSARDNPPGHLLYLEITYSTTNIKTINGLAIASVKTVDGLAIASVKTINGLA